MPSPEAFQTHGSPALDCRGHGDWLLDLEKVTAHSLYVLATGSLRSDRNISDLALQTLGGLIGAKPQKPLLVDLAHLAAYAACAAAGGNCPFYRLRNTGSLQ